MTVKGINLWADNLIKNIRREDNNYTYQKKTDNVFQALEKSVKKWPDNMALVSEEQSLNYRQFLIRVKKIAARLAQEHSLQSGDRVVLIEDKPLDFVLIFYALMGLECSAVVLNSKLSEKKLNYQISDSEPVLIIASRDMLEDVNADISVSFEEIMQSSLPEPIELAARTKSNDLAVLLYTSGTTGMPKGVKINHGHILDAVISYRDILELDEAASSLICVPLFYVTGLVAQLILFMNIGGSIYLLDRFDEDKVIDLVNENNISFFHATETVYKLLTNRCREIGRAMKSIEMALCGGGPCSFSTIKDIKKYMPAVDFRTVYGLTETTSPASIFPCHRIEENPDSAGLPIPLIEARIVDTNLRDLPRGEAGELLLRGGNVIDGYWKDNESEAFIDGWFRTGDIARIDDKGYLYILDRLKDMINRGGEKVYSIEVENELKTIPGIADGAVVGIPHEIYGEEVMAFAIQEEDYELTEEDVLKKIAHELPKYKRPKKIKFVDSLPRNENGKVLKKRLRMMV